MTDEQPDDYLPVLIDHYEVERSKPNRWGKTDWTVTGDHLVASAAQADDLVTALGRFFDGIENEIIQYSADPIALSHALAHIETIAADVRWVHGLLQRAAARALDAANVKRLAVEGIGVFEPSGYYKRSEWEHERLMREVIARMGYRFIDANGEVIEPGEVAVELLDVFTPSWKKGGLEPLGLDWNEYCTIDRDEDDKPVVTPTVKVVSNAVRARRAQ
jgi:hypothetical protein